MKYDNILHMNTNNSASNILRNVKPNTTVLELGAGNGYMTQYLKETLHCETTVVEIDDANFDKLIPYVQYYYIGKDDGDIENYNWCNGVKYDHIIFADVLEHLYNPWYCLKQAARLLEDNGTILISIPNVSHNSVIIDLINDKFEYRELGLLDNTHIRFFTRKTLLKMVSDAGLIVSKEMDTHCAVEHSEFKNSFLDIDIAIGKTLKARKDGDVYQFVWELKNI